MTISSLANRTILTPYHHNGPGSNGTVTRLVIHATVSPCVRGGAVNNANYFMQASAGGAAHYIVDPGAIVCSVDEDQKAAHAPPNAGSIGIELCDPQTGDPGRWADADHQSMLHLAAALSADICARHNLPAVWLSPADLIAGKTGITSHANVALAWHQSDHSDPGNAFPVDQFLAFISGAPSPGGNPFMALTDQEQAELYHSVKAMHKTNWIDDAGYGDLQWFAKQMAAALKPVNDRLTAIEKKLGL